MTTSNENQIPTPLEIYVPTPLEISEFKRGLARGFQYGEANAGIKRWIDPFGFVPKQWAYELLESGECDDLDWHSCPMDWHSCPTYEPPVFITQHSIMPSRQRKRVLRWLYEIRG